MTRESFVPEPEAKAWVTGLGAPQLIASMLQSNGIRSFLRQEVLKFAHDLRRAAAAVGCIAFLHFLLRRQLSRKLLAWLRSYLTGSSFESSARNNISLNNSLRVTEARPAEKGNSKGKGKGNWRVNGAELSLSGLLEDMDKVEDWCARQAVPTFQSYGDKRIDSIDLSNNHLSDRGLECIIDVLISFGKPIRRLKFFANFLVFPESICHLLEDTRCGLGTPGGPTELHLSHNALELRFLQTLLQSFCKHKASIKKQITPPFKIRAEQNGLEAAGIELAKLCFQQGLLVDLVRQARFKEADPQADVHLMV